MMTSLSDSYMVAQVSLKKWVVPEGGGAGKWEAPAATEHVSVVNNTLYSLWRGNDQMNENRKGFFPLINCCILFFSISFF